MTIDHEAAFRFLRTAYEPDDWIAVFLKSYETGRAAQRVAPVSTVMSPSVQTWLSRENCRCANIFVSVNALRPRTASRRRSDVAAIRHVFLDADEDGPGVVAAIGARGDLPAPSYVLHSSPRRVHIFWRVAEFTIRQVEALQRQLARDLHTDAAATACSQTTRLGGFWNHKHARAALVRVDYGHSGLVYSPTDFPTPAAIDPVRSRVRPYRATSNHDDVVERARQYAAALPPAIAGQHGDARTFRLCCRLARGFALTDTDALTILTDWNARCEPPWSERELIAKLQHARRYGREPFGGLLEAQP